MVSGYPVIYTLATAVNFAICHNQLKYIYAQWNPFMDPKRGRSLFAAWRLLLAKAYGAGQFVDPALGDLLVQVWLPRVRSVIK